MPSVLALKPARRRLSAGVAVLLLTCGMSWASPPAAVSRAAGEARALLGRFEAERALELVERAIAEHPDSAVLRGMKGFALFSQGRYHEATEWLDGAVAVNAESEHLRELAELARRTSRLIDSFTTHGSAHFVVFLDEEADGVLVPYLLEALEGPRGAVGEDLGYYPAEAVRVEVYPTAEAFYEASGLTRRDIEVSGAVGLCRYNKIMMLSPRALVKGYRWLDTASHEYVHYVLTRLAGSNLPIWLHEGIARYEEARWRGPHRDVLGPVAESLLAGALSSGRWLSFAEMEPSLVHLETLQDVNLAYAECAAAVQWISTSRGLEGLRGILEMLGASEEVRAEEAIGRTLGLTPSEFDEAWRAALRERGLRELEGVEPRRYVVADGGPGATSALRLEDIRSLAARQLTGLADGLRERGRLRPAVAEYRRALARSPYEEIVLTKLGIALLESGRGDEARECFEAVLARAPDAVSAHKYLGLLALRQERYEEARAATQEAVQINPFDPDLHRTLSLVYAMLGRSELAGREERIHRRLLGAPAGPE